MQYLLHNRNASIFIRSLSNANINAPIFIMLRTNLMTSCIRSNQSLIMATIRKFLILRFTFSINSTKKNHTLDMRTNSLSTLMIFVAGGLADRSPVPAAYCRQQSDFILLLSKAQGTSFQRTYLSLVSTNFSNETCRKDKSRKYRCDQAYSI